MIKRQRDFPREVRVRDATYRVRFARRIPGEPADTVGLCDSGDDKTIWIKMGQSPRDRFKTYIHETTHALCDEWRLPDVTHRLIYALEEPLLRLLVDNL